MSFYSNLAATALSVITSKGQDVTLRAVANTTPGNAWEPTRTPTNSTVKSVREYYNVGEIDGDLVRQGDRRYMVAASGLSAAPNTDDRLVDDIEMEIVNVEVVSPAGTPVVYIVQTRAN